MKATKSKVYCRDINRSKILFETEKKADTFIKFNGNEIKSQSGYSPVRSYFCVSCCGWHVTSKEDKPTFKTKTEIVVEEYRVYKTSHDEKIRLYEEKIKTKKKKKNKYHEQH